VTLGGIPLRRGQAVVLALGDPGRITRGTPLARLAARVALTALLRRLPGIRLACDRTDLMWHYGPMTNGPLALPVRLTLEP
jgi:cytochrome P450